MYGISGTGNITADIWRNSMRPDSGNPTLDVSGSGGAVATGDFQNILTDAGSPSTKALQQGPTLDQRTSALINRLDKDGDGQLSSEEMGISQDAFAGIDANSDGKLDMRELNNAYLAQHAAQQYGIAMNGSGPTTQQ